MNNQIFIFGCSSNFLFFLVVTATNKIGCCGESLKNNNKQVIFCFMYVTVLLPFFEDSFVGVNYRSLRYDRSPFKFVTMTVSLHKTVINDER